MLDTADDVNMSATVVYEKRQTTLPAAIADAVGLKANDKIEWRVEDGEIRGRKVTPEGDGEAFPAGSLLPYLTAERDDEQLAILSGCVKGPAESD